MERASKESTKEQFRSVAFRMPSLSGHEKAVENQLPLLTCVVPKSKPQIGIEAEQSFLFCHKKICLKRRRSSQIRAPLGSFFVASVASVEVVVMERQVQRQRSFLVVALKASSCPESPRFVC